MKMLGVDPFHFFLFSGFVLISFNLGASFCFANRIVAPEYIEEIHCELELQAQIYAPSPVAKMGEKSVIRQIIIRNPMSHNPILIDKAHSRVSPLVRVDSRKNLSSEWEFMRLHSHVNENFALDMIQQKITYTMIIDLNDSNVPFTSVGTCRFVKSPAQ